MPTNDFNGDGRSDILWLLEEVSAVSNWLATPSGTFTINDANAFHWLSAWHLFELQATGDFNGDGTTDLIFEVDESGGRSIWLADETGGFPESFSSTLGFSVGDPSWAIAGTGDFNGDGVDDLLWRNADGTISNWLGSTTGAFTINDAKALIHVPNDWHIVTTADFDGDGRADILWRNDNGMISNWLGTDDGGFVINDANALTESFGVIAGVGDFNGDGRSDIAWRQAEEVHVSDTLPGGTMYSAGWNTGFVADVPLDWYIAATGDYDEDGADDILWRAEDGTLTRWLSQGDGYHYQSNVIAQVSNDWQIADYLLA
jgi:FG-GAP-like repeat/FG-GAP repeat